VPTSFVVKTLFVLTTINNAGQLAPIDRSEWPAGGGPVFMSSEEYCLMARGRMANPQKYVCQGFTGAASARWAPDGGNDNASEPPPSPDHASIPLGPTEPQVGKLSPRSEPEAKPEPPKPAKKIESKLSTTDWPGMSTNVIHLDDSKGRTNDGCRNYALSIMGKLSLSNIMAAGENTTAGTANIEGHDYVVTVRCEVESKIVFFSAAGPTAANASKALDLFLATWADKKEAAPREQKPTTERDATATPKKLAQQPRRTQTAMFEGSPLTGLFNW
jgi:hypothetical protein